MHGNTSRVTRTSNGDVYAGRDGNVYRKEGDSIQKYNDGGWNNVDRATPEQRQQAASQAGTRATTSGMDSATREQVNRDSAARAEGAQRTRESSQMQSSGGSSRSGSYSAAVVVS